MQPIVIRGGGDIASGTIARLCRAGYCVIVLECAYPTAIRRDVAFSEVIYKNQIPGAGNTVTLEGVTMHLAEDVLYQELGVVLDIPKDQFLDYIIKEIEGNI